MPQGTQMGKQKKRWLYRIYSLRCQIAQQLLFGRFCFIRIIGRKLQMIRIPEIEEIETVAADEEKLFSNRIQLIQINLKHKYPVMELMLFRLHAVMHYIR